jgi:hypothetical protein
MQWGEGFQAMQLSEPPLSVSIGLITLRGRYLCPAAAGLVSLIQARAGKRMDPKCIPVPAAAVSAS